MNRQRKAALDAGTPGRQVETGTYEKTSISTSKDTTHGTTRQPGLIESLLSPGAENAVPLQHLAKITELPARQVRQHIQAERLRGAQILADNERGYFLPQTQEDVESFYRSMLHRAAEITRVATAVMLRGRRFD